MSEFHVEVGAYALDSLDENERAAFEEHLAGCESCQRELLEFSETAARMSALSDTPPPPNLRPAVLSAIREVRPLPPLEVPTSAPEPSPSASRSPQPQPQPQRGAGPAELPGGVRDDVTAGSEVSARRALPDADAVESDPPVWPAETPTPGSGDELAARRLRRRSRILTLAVAAATVIALAFGGWTYVLHQNQQVMVSDGAAATRLLSAPDVRTYPVKIEGVPATFVVSKSLDQAMFVGADLPAADAGRTYQLWTVGADKHASPDATFTGGPNTREFMTGDIDDAAALAISSEPAGGSKAPTDVLGQAPLDS